MITLMEQTKCTTCGVRDDEHIVKLQGYVLLVKSADHDNAEEVAFERFEDMPLNAGPCDIEADLNGWLLEYGNAPFPPDTLLWWRRGW